MNRREALLALSSMATILGVRRTAHAGDGVAVVVHKDNPIATMSKGQLDSIFKVKSTKFPGGDRASPVNLPLDHPARKVFDEVVLGLTPSEVERFWIDSKIRSGNGAPRKLPTAASVLRFVGSDPTGLGYIPVGEVDRSVKVVARIVDGRVSLLEVARG